MIYKDVKLTDNVLNYISTYHILDSDNLMKYLDEDEPFQNMIKHQKTEAKQHERKIKIYKTLYNLFIYALLYSGFVMMKG